MSSNSTEKPQTSLTERVINHARAMADGTPDQDAVIRVLTQRAVEALALAQKMAEACDKAHRLDAEAMDKIALRALETWEPKSALTGLRHMIISYLGPECVPDKPLDAWVKRAKADMAGLEGHDSPETGLLDEELEAPAPSPAPPEPAAHLTEADMVEVERDARGLQAGETAAMSAYDVMKQVGRIEGIEFVRRCADVALAQTFVEIKQSKQYKSILITDESGKVRHCADFAEFCQVKLKTSYRRCAELAQNLHLLGPELYEHAENMGLARKDYRTMRALPEESQLVVKQAIEAESKEQVVDLLQDLAAQEAAKQEALTKENDGLKADLEARDNLLATRAETLEKRDLELAKLKSLPPAENVRLKLAREREAVGSLGPAEVTAEAALNEFLGQVADVLEAQDVSQHTKTYAQDMVRMFCERVIDFLAANYIDIDLAQLAGIVPGWDKDAAEGEIAATSGQRTDA